MSNDDLAKEKQAIYTEIEQLADNIKSRVSDSFKGDFIGKCFSCSKAWIYKTKRGNDPTIICKEVFTDKPLVMPTDVLECNQYAKNGEIDIWDQVRMHKIIDLGVREKVMGFKQADGESTQDK